VKPLHVEGFYLDVLEDGLTAAVIRIIRNLDSMLLKQFFYCIAVKPKKASVTVTREPFQLSPMFVSGYPCGAPYCVPF